MRLFVVAIGLMGLMACNNENQVTNLCAHNTSGFDIEAASVLEDGQGYPQLHDAVILDLDPTQVPDGAAWRVRSVDIMPLLPASQFASYADGQPVTVEVWDANNPNGTPFTVTQPFHKADLDWTDENLDNPTTATEHAQKSSWWTFDFGDVIPTTGMTATQYLVGVAWGAQGMPPLGYSNFNRACDKNWTDYGIDPYYYTDMGWVLNGDTAGATCSWPMLKVNLEILQEQAVCDQNAVVVQ